MPLMAMFRQQKPRPSSPFGEALIVASARGVAGLGWVSTVEDGGKTIGGRADALADMERRWPNAQFILDPQSTTAYAARIFDPKAWSQETPLRVVRARYPDGRMGSDPALATPEKGAELVATAAAGLIEDVNAFSAEVAPV